MTTNYNTIAEQYQRIKKQAWREHIETGTFFKLVGDVTGKAVLDLACGEGFLTRPLAQKGASRVVGVDLSERMIDLAQEQETREPLGISYLVHDARDLNLPERFDLVVAGYLLNYASSANELLKMCRTVARHLRPGGRFVTINNNPAQPPEYFSICRKYGYTKRLAGPLAEGTPIIYRFIQGDESFEITNYHLSVATHEWAFEMAGLRDVRWHLPEVTRAGAEAFGKDYWADFLAHPPIVFIECRK